MRAAPKLTAAQRALLLHTRYDDLTRVFPGAPRRWLHAEQRRLRAEQPESLTVAAEAAQVAQAAATRSDGRRYQSALREIAQLRAQLDALAGAPGISPRDVSIASEAGRREATAIVLASDWHAEERVRPEQVNTLNEYNLEIFDARSRWFFKNTAKLVDKEACAVEIRNLVLWLGGDLISGGIHEDLAESNQLGPVDALALAQDTVAGGIAQLLKDLPGITLTIAVSVGNHSRITNRPRVQTEHEHSLEWLMGHNLAREFRGEPRVRFICDRSYLTYLDVHGLTLRFHHGHAMRYYGGVGGLTVPANKAIAEWNKGRHADLDCFGHFHTLFFGPDFVANGSMIGYSPFAVSIKAPFQRPSQAFFLIDSTHGLTVRAPVLLESA